MAQLEKTEHFPKYHTSLIIICLNKSSDLVHMCFVVAKRDGWIKDDIFFIVL